jgi:hypothetical protein
MNLPFTLPFTLPDWMPAWAFLLLALPVLLYALVFLIMPFSVFGVKARLESLEAQLNDIHEEIRYLANRSAPAARGFVADDQDYDTLPQFNRLKSTRPAPPPPPQAAPPPIPPAPLTPMVTPREQPRLPQRPARRTEPRLD